MLFEDPAFSSPLPFFCIGEIYVDEHHAACGSELRRKFPHQLGSHVVDVIYGLVRDVSSARPSYCHQRAGYRPADLTGPRDATPETGRDPGEPVSRYPQALHVREQHRLSSVETFRQEEFPGPHWHTLVFVLRFQDHRPLSGELHRGRLTGLDGLGYR